MLKPSNTYYILDSKSTFPFLITLKDYYRDTNPKDKDKTSLQMIAELEKHGYKLLVKRKEPIDNEIICIYGKDNEYELIK